MQINDTTDAHNSINEFLDEILENAESEAAQQAVTNLLDSVGEIGANRYSTRNQLLLQIQLDSRDVDWRASAKYFAGFNTWIQEYNRAVTEGSKGFKILAPVTGLSCPECGNAPSYHENDWVDCTRSGTDPDTWDINPETEWSEGVLYFRTATTFAYEQTEPVEDPDGDVWEPSERTKVEGDPAYAEELFEAMKTAAETGNVTGQEVTVTVTDRAMLGTEGTGGSGNVEISSGVSAQQSLRVLAHELAHENLHGLTMFGDSTGRRAVREAEADAVAYVVSKHFGFTPDSDVYIAGWMRAINELSGEDITPRDVLHDRIDEVRQTAANIINATKQVQTDETVSKSTGTEGGVVHG